MVSILITTYNSAAHLKACLESVLQQEFSDREIIVVDNASSDGTRAVLQEFETRARVIYNDTNRGFSGGQNQAISACARGLDAVAQSRRIAKPGLSNEASGSRRERCPHRNRMRKAAALGPGR